MYEMLVQESLHLPLFQDLTREQLARLEPLLTLVNLPAGTTVFEQGQAADYLYIVLKGEVIIRYKPYDGPALTVARVGPGGILGWSSVLGRHIYNSEAYTTEASEAYRIGGSDIQNLCQQYPDTGVIILERLAAVIAERLSGTHTQILAILAEGVDRNGEGKRRNERHDDVK